MANNPNPSRITDAWWWFMQELLKLEPGSQNGGIFANKPGYHNTRNNNSPSNYSVREFAADRRGPADKGAGGDWTFPDAQSGRYGTIIKYSYRLLQSGTNPRDTRLDGWREFYGQADWDTAVEGWDFQKIEPSSSDASHLWHIHFSELRQFTEDYENKKKMLSVLRGETYDQWLASQHQPEEDDDMPNVIPLELHFLKIGQRREFTLPWGEGNTQPQAVFTCDGGAGRIRAVYMADDNQGWKPMFGSDWGNPAHVERLIKSEQQGMDNLAKLPTKLCKIAVDLLEVDLGKDPDTGEPNTDLDKFSLSGLVQYFKG